MPQKRAKKEENNRTLNEIYIYDIISANDIDMINLFVNVHKQRWMNVKFTYTCIWVFTFISMLRCI